mmetsp:Transcript_43542/g.44061  ORF Transcript_43542/g.44061 Transcript_43542/m.44061 type:complete len:111 (-) Transcript_43542:498-830(-)
MMFEYLACAEIKKKFSFNIDRQKKKMRDGGGASTNNKRLAFPKRLIKPPAGSPLDRGNSSGANNAKIPHNLPEPGIISATTTNSNSHLQGKTSAPKKKTVSEFYQASRSQ